MSDTLTQLIAKVQATLQDNGTLFTTPTITAACRQALLDLNKRAACHAAETAISVADQKVYEVADPTATGITDVLLFTIGDCDQPLEYVAYVEDARWWYRLKTTLPAGKTIIVNYTQPHTVSGLDGATDSTLDDALNVALLNGTVYYSCLSRAAATLEANNVAPNVPLNWLKLADMWADIFTNSLAAASREPVAKGEPIQAMKWDDDQHNPLYP